MNEAKKSIENAETAGEAPKTEKASLHETDEEPVDLDKDMNGLA
jgi:hypothetical protein